MDHLYIIEVLGEDALNEDDWVLTSFVYFHRENAEEDMPEIKSNLRPPIRDIRVSEWWRTSWH